MGAIRVLRGILKRHEKPVEPVSAPAYMCPFCGNDKRQGFHDCLGVFDGVRFLRGEETKNVVARLSRKSGIQNKVLLKDHLENIKNLDPVVWEQREKEYLFLRERHRLSQEANMKQLIAKLDWDTEEDLWTS